jgi:hypothetical protein
VLVAVTLFDAFVVHNPIVEHGRAFHLDLKHFLLSLTIASSLLMVAGFRRL